MATIDTFSEASARSAEPGAGATTGTAESGLLVSLFALDHEGLARTLSNLSAAFPGESLLIATPDAAPETSSAESSQGNIRMIPYTPAVASRESWVLTAPDYFNAFKLAKDHGAGAVLMLGSESASLDPQSLRKLGLAIAGGADIASPDYRLGPREGLVNSAILYPVTRSLFGTRPRFPLATDLGLSVRMAERLATAAQRFTAINQMDALLWPLAEAAAAGYNIVDIPDVSRSIPQPGTSDLNAVLARVAGSLFADVDAKAALWQRIRTTQPPNANPAPVAPASREQTPDISAMLETFRIAYTNLAEIWSLVLPPNSLLGLKRLAATPAATFRMPDALWARIVFDFILAYRLRTLNRGHLLGALTPLYLAWVASHLAQTGDPASAERHIESVAAAFEAEKPYLVSRWRWPDRFNP
jgi:hypothetical protein